MHCHSMMFVIGVVSLAAVHASPPFFGVTVEVEDPFVFDELIKLMETKKNRDPCMDCKANPPIVSTRNIMVQGVNASFQLDLWCEVMDMNMRCKMAHLNKCNKKEAQDFEVRYAEYNSTIKHLCVRTKYRDGLLKQLPCLTTSVLPQVYDCFKTFESQAHEAKEDLKSVKIYDKIQQEDEEYLYNQKICDSNEQFSSCVIDAARLFCGLNAELYVRHFLDQLMVEYRAMCQEPRTSNHWYRGPKIIRAKKIKTKN